MFNFFTPPSGTSEWFLHLIQTLFMSSGAILTVLFLYFKVWKQIIEPQILKRENAKKLLVEEHSRKQQEFVNIVNNQQHFFNHIESMNKKLDTIAYEVKDNGGGSLKDTVKQIARDIKVIRVERDATFYLSKEAMVKHDERGYCTAANYALCNLYGTTQEEMLGLGWLNFVAEEDKHRLKSEWENIIESGKEISTYYTVNNPSTNEAIHIKYKAIVNRDGEELISVIGTIEKTSKKIYKTLTTA